MVTEHSWNSEDVVGQLISVLITTHQCKQVLEVGVFKGATALYMMRPDTTYIGIDIEDHREQEVRERMKAHEFLLGDSLKMLPKITPRSIDLAFIDSVHEYKHCMAEFKICETLIKPGGLIVFHDAVKWPGVAEVVKYIKSFSHFDALVLNTPHGEGVAVVRCNY